MRSIASVRTHATSLARGFIFRYPEKRAFARRVFPCCVRNVYRRRRVSRNGATRNRSCSRRGGGFAVCVSKPKGVPRWWRETREGCNPLGRAGGAGESKGEAGGKI